MRGIKVGEKERSSKIIKDKMLKAVKA